MLAKTKKEAFSDFYEKYARRIYSFVNTRSFHRDNKEDTVQKVFEIAWKRFDEYLAEPRNDFWIFRIAENMVKYENRKISRYQEVLVADHENLERLQQPAYGESELEQALIRVELHDHLSSFIKQLPRKQQAVLSLRLTGITYRQIGKSLNISSEAARRRMERAIKAGKDYFEY